MNTYYTGKFINVGFFKQMRDLLPTILYATSMGFLVWGVTLFISSEILQLIVGPILGIMSYVAISKMMRSMELFYLVDIFKQSVWKKYVSRGSS